MTRTCSNSSVKYRPKEHVAIVLLNSPLCPGMLLKGPHFLEKRSLTCPVAFSHGSSQSMSMRPSFLPSLSLNWLLPLPGQCYTHPFCFFFHLFAQPVLLSGWPPVALWTCLSVQTSSSPTPSEESSFPTPGLPGLGVPRAREPDGDLAPVRAEGCEWRICRWTHVRCSLKTPRNTVEEGGILQRARGKNLFTLCSLFSRLSSLPVFTSNWPQARFRNQIPEAGGFASIVASEQCFEMYLRR